MEYPKLYLRGISRDDSQFFNPPIPNTTFRIPTANIFSGGFDSNDERQDDFEELSINWIDDDGAFEVAFNQKNSKSGECQFKAGVGVYDFGTLKEIVSSQYFKEVLDYERAPIPNNKYHGNILLHKGVSAEKSMKSMKNMICGKIAMAYVEYRENPNV